VLRGWDIIQVVYHAMLEAKVAVVMIPIPRLVISVLPLTMNSVVSGLTTLLKAKER
jgi:hypothetical protein